jgi:hypothetical protein
MKNQLSFADIEHPPRPELQKERDFFLIWKPLCLSKNGFV